MKKVLVVLPTLPNYRKDFFNALSAELAEKNIELMIFHGSTKKKVIKEIENKKFKTRYFETTERTLGGFTITSLKNLTKAVKEYSPDCLITLFNPATISLIRVLLYCIKKRIPYAIWSCGWVRPSLAKTVGGIREKILLYFDKRATAHIAYHTQRKKYLISKDIPSDTIFVAQNTIDTEQIMQSYHFEEISHRRFNNTLNVLFVGALIKMKYLEESMNVIDKLISSGISITFTIIGGGSIIDKLKAHRETLSNKENILILGPKYGDELKSYFLQSDLFLLSGAGGLAVNEAMAYGLPVISTAGDGTGYDLIKNNGYLLNEPGNEAEIKAALEDFAHLSRNQKLQMSENSLAIIKNKATNSLMVKNYMQAIDMMLKK